MQAASEIKLKGLDNYDRNISLEGYERYKNNMVILKKKITDIFRFIKLKHWKENEDVLKFKWYISLLIEQRNSMNSIIATLKYMGYIKSFWQTQIIRLRVNDMIERDIGD